MNLQNISTFESFQKKHEKIVACGNVEINFPKIDQRPSITHRLIAERQFWASAKLEIVFFFLHVEQCVWGRTFIKVRRHCHMRRNFQSILSNFCKGKVSPFAKLHFYSCSMNSLCIWKRQISAILWKHVAWKLSIRK